MGQSLSFKFLKHPDVLLKDIRVAIKEGLVKIENRASRVHRYKIRSGNLSKGFRTEMVNDLVGIIFLDGSASGAGAYDIFVHEGQRSWKPDKYLIKAGKHLDKEIAEDIVKAGLGSIGKVFK